MATPAATRESIPTTDSAANESVAGAHRRIVVRGKALAAAGLGLLGAVLLCELILRLAGVSYPNFYRWDSALGSSLRPGAAGRWTREGGSFVRINSHGQRDREHSIDKPDGTYRIAVLGDSYAEAFQVDLEDAFWAVMERRLGDCPRFQDRDVEVINFGVAGYGTAQELLMFRQHARRFSPDLVLLAFLPGNDLRNNSRALEADPYRPYFRLGAEGLELDDSFRDTAHFQSRQSTLYRVYDGLVRRSRLLQLVREARARSQASAAAAALGEEGQGELGLDDRVYLPPDVGWEEAWQVTEALIRQLRDEVDRSGAEFLLVTLTNGIQVHPDPAARTAFQERLGVSDLLYAERRAAALGETEGIVTLNLTLPMRAAAETRGVHLHGFGDAPGTGHWNEEGHRVAGELLSEFICRTPTEEAPAGMEHSEP